MAQWTAQHYTTTFFVKLLPQTPTALEKLRWAARKNASLSPQNGAQLVRLQSYCLDWKSNSATFSVTTSTSTLHIFLCLFFLQWDWSDRFAVTIEEQCMIRSLKTRAIFLLFSLFYSFSSPFSTFSSASSSFFSSSFFILLHHNYYLIPLTNVHWILTMCQNTLLWPGITSMNKILAYLILFCFTLQCFSDTAFFTNWRSVTTLHQASLLAPFFNSICISHVCVTFC